MAKKNVLMEAKTKKINLDMTTTKKKQEQDSEVIKPKKKTLVNKKVDKLRLISIKPWTVMIGN